MNLILDCRRTSNFDPFPPQNFGEKEKLLKRDQDNFVLER